MASDFDIAVLANARAAADDRLREAVRRLRDGGLRVRVYPLWETGDGERLAREAARNARLVAAAGGDGTLNEAVNGLMAVPAERRPAFTVLPYGTANDFAKTCGVPLTDPLNALRQALAAPTVWVDAGRVNGRYFLNAATGGGPARSTAGTRGRLKKTVGRLAYVVAGLRDLSRLPIYDASARWDGGRWRGRIFGLGVGNGRQAGGGVRFAPKALLDDGLLDVVIVPEQPVKQLLALTRDFVRPKTGRRSGHLISFRSRRLELAVRGRLPLNLDGEPTRERSYRFEAVPRAIPLKAPRPPLKR